MPEARVGISGWVYPNWRGDFYPKGLRQFGYTQPEMPTRASGIATPRSRGVRR